MEQEIRTVTMQGNPLTLSGGIVNEGDVAPDVELLDNNLTPVKLSSFRGKVCIISSAKNRFSLGLFLF